MKKYLLFFSALTSIVSYTYADEESQSINLGKSVVYGYMMKSHLDELNRNVYEVDRDSIQERGYRSSEDIFRYTPFVGLANVGLGSNLDLRGQGNRANTSVQVLVNGIYANMLDSSHGVSPINTLSPYSIEAIEILPGGGAVMYGNGTRGGVVNIITQRRYAQPFFSAGITYSNVIASTGNNVNADAKFGTKIGDSTYISLGAAYLLRGGPREGDKINGGQANMSLIKDFAGGGSSLSFDIDYFYGDIRTSPNNSFNDIPNPTRSDRKTPGNGDLHNKQQRLDVSLGYEANVSENSKFDLKAFYHLNKIKYVDSVTGINNYLYGGRFLFPLAEADQSGSLFDDQKIGLIAKYDLKHSNGRFILGYESVYQYGKRIMDQLIFADASSVPTNVNAFNFYIHPMLISLKSGKWSNALFAIEKYNFTESFSLTGGVRYENAWYKADVSNSQNVLICAANITSQVNCLANPTQNIPIDAARNYNTTSNNFALELTPSYQYSNDGNMYAKYERGFFSPSPNNLLTRQSSQYLLTNLKQETYDTFELGLKDFWGESVSFSAALFYTLTHNEFYTIGNAHSASGVTYGNYDKTQRLGVELFSEQYLFNNILRLSESFTYIDASVLRNNGSKSDLKIPYVSNYKGTIGVELALGRSFSIWTQNTFMGKQKDVETFTTTGMGQSATSTSNGQKTIPAYSLTDIGLNAKFGDLSLSAGVRNVFDTFYYSYYNADSSDVIAGYGFLIGQGRSAFVEGRWTF